MDFRGPRNNFYFFLNQSMSRNWTLPNQTLEMGVTILISILEPKLFLTKHALMYKVFFNQSYGSFWTIR